MKRTIIVIAIIMILASAFLALQTNERITHWNSLGYGPSDILADPVVQTSPGINVMLTRAADWKKIVSEPLFNVGTMRMIDGSTATIPITAEILRQFYGFSNETLNTSSLVKHSTTHSAYTNLINRRQVTKDGYQSMIDLIFVTPPSDEEKQLAADKKVVLDIEPIALDGFVFITHVDNPIDSLTVAQVRDIYSGRITNWKEVGGPDLEIKAYQREPNSGSQTAMLQLVMDGRAMGEAPGVIIKPINSMLGLVEAVAEYSNGPASIGYTYYYYVKNLYINKNVKVLKINGISPENENLIDKSYPFTASYYAVMRGDEPENSPARRLRDFLLTSQGQELIRIAGYCPVVQEAQ